MKIRERTAAALSEMKIEDLARRDLSRLSAGQRQRRLVQPAHRQQHVPRVREQLDIFISAARKRASATSRVGPCTMILAIIGS